MIPNWLTWVKRVSALLLFVALFFPLSRCQDASTVHYDVNAPADQQPQTPPSEMKYDYHYAWSNFDAAEPGDYVALLVFLWPIPVLLLELFARRRWLVLTLLWLQPVLCLGAGYVLYMRTFLEQLWTGGYMAFAALAAYLFASLYALTRELILARRRRKDAPAAAGPPPVP